MLGAIAGNILPTLIVNSLGIALYAMFIAIIVPPATRVKGILSAILFAAGISCIFYFVPILSEISTGISIIITAVLASIITALIFPIKEGGNKNG